MGSKFTSIWVGIQRIESDLHRVLDDTFQIMRIDSDSYKKPREILENIGKSDVIVATSIANLLTSPDIGAVVFLYFEVNLSIPEYDLEEQLFTEISYFKKQGIPLYIQTYNPDHPLLDTILFGNYQTLLTYLVNERKQFWYPPFSEFAIIRVHDEQKAKVQNMLIRLVNKISQIQQASTFVAYDRDIWEKYAGEWVQKIILKDTSLAYLIDQLETEIVRNRSVTLEWK
jgi:primosomal protein N' (replication factor Y)